MVDRKVLRKEFAELKNAITKLKELEKKLEELNPPENVFSSQIASIRAKLKDPDQVKEAEQELNALQKQMQDRSTMPDGITGPMPTLDSQHIFPPELEALYYEASFIGQGGFARVFKAIRKKDDTEVAVKIPGHIDPQTGKSFLSEIHSWQRLKHRNIVSLYDFNIAPVTYLEMELCQRSLNEMRMPLEVEQAAGIIFHIAEGISYAHSQGVIHRDLKPHNILLQGEVPKIVDWGLSKVMDESRTSGEDLFSIYWAAPEQISSQKFGKPDQRTDIWQLGIIFYEMVTGKRSFDGDTNVEIMGQIITEEPKPPSFFRPAASVVDHIIMKCLNKKMEDRYQSVGEMQKALADYLKIEYRESLTKSRGNMTRSAYYCAQLFLLHMRLSEPAEVLKYCMDLKGYARGDGRDEVERLAAEIEFRMKEGMQMDEELFARAEVIAHRAQMGRE